MHISSITTQPNQTYTVVVSDEDNFDAVLPVQTVRYISVSRSQILLPPYYCHAYISLSLTFLRPVQTYSRYLPQPLQLSMRFGFEG